MLTGPGLAISVPALELQKTEVPSSVFGITHLLDAPISSELRMALDLIQSVSVHQTYRILIVARPEIFTNGPTLNWLKQKLGGIRDHLCICDGLTIKTVAGMNNHVFLYRHSTKLNADAFQTQIKRAPELFGEIASQINTNLLFKSDNVAFSPPTYFLPKAENGTAPSPPLFSRFQLNCGSMDFSVEQTLKSTFNILRNTDFSRATYIPLTDLALSNSGYCKHLASVITRAYYDTSGCLLLRLPLSASSPMDDRIRLTLSSLARATSNIPSSPAPNVFFISEDLDDTHKLIGRLPAQLIAPISFDYWRHTAEFFRSFTQIAVVLSREEHHSSSPDWLRKAFGRLPALTWIDPNV